MEYRANGIGHKMELLELCCLNPGETFYTIKSDGKLWAKWVFHGIMNGKVFVTPAGPMGDSTTVLDCSDMFSKKLKNLPPVGMALGLTFDNPSIGVYTEIELVGEEYLTIEIELLRSKYILNP